MAATRRDLNENFFKWEPVKEGNQRFTPNRPFNWLYEIFESAEFSASEVEEGIETDSTWEHREEIHAAEERSRLTPSNDELLKLAQKFPPPPEWLEGDEEKPF